jgi:ubiquinone/menaquinone biosynthesis C-methylase UbiE
MFAGMSLAFRVQDWLFPRGEILDRAGIQVGDRVLDYGCGPGSYVVELARRVGEAGRVYALDVHPAAIERVRSLVRQHTLDNVELIQSDCTTGLMGNSIDIVLLYDVLHMLTNPNRVLRELRRVLKPEGTLSVLDPHMSREDLVSQVIDGGQFWLCQENAGIMSFDPI